MSDVFQLLLNLDQDAARVTSELHWSPATAFLVLASAWWVKGPLVVGLGWCADLRCRRAFPLVALAATVSFFIATALNAIIKELVDRSRPPLTVDVDALVAVPASSSFPSGHAMSAFATCAAVALLAPRLRWPVLSLAAVIAVSRAYLGVHFWLDVLAGAAFGLVIGLLVAVALKRVVGRQARAASGDGTVVAG